MVKWSYFKYFFSFTKFLAGELYDNRKRFEYENNSYYDKYRYSICQECHKPEICSQSQWTDVSHEEFCGFNIEPQKRNECSTYTHTKSREEKESLIISDKPVYSIGE